MEREEAEGEAEPDGFGRCDAVPKYTAVKTTQDREAVTQLRGRVRVEAGADGGR